MCFGDMVELDVLLEDLLLYLMVIFMVDNCFGIECLFWDDCFVV